MSFRILGPHNPRTSCPPGKCRTFKEGPPHLLVISAPRSGTHLLIDAVLNNLPAYRKKPLYVELDQLFSSPCSLEGLVNTRGYVIKSHHPVTPGMELSQQDRLYLEKIHAASLTVFLTRDPENAARSAKRMWPNLNQEQFKTDIKKQKDYWSTKADIHIEFNDLITPLSFEKVLLKISTASNTPLRKTILQPQAKGQRWIIYVLKAITRLLGRHSPRINTGIKLGN